jgi:hypothetical protein
VAGVALWAVAEPGIEVSRGKHIRSNFFEAPKQGLLTKYMIKKVSIFIIHEVQHENPYK